ncbi:MAG: response regulator transcription factor [Verrucomicrobiota bacterium]
MKVLIIEDEDDLRSVLLKDLREEGYTLETESDGANGLLRAQHFDFDLILLDVMLPGLDGWQVLERLRRTKQTPVLMLTARDSTEDRVRGLNLGCDDYVVKPFELEELKARIRALIRRSQGTPAPLVSINAEIQLDTNRRRVLKNGRDLELPMKELSLLEIFVQRMGTVVPRETIAELLYADLKESESNVIDVYIYQLRAKLGRGIIKTRRGLGYELPKYP